MAAKFRNKDHLSSQDIQILLWCRIIDKNLILLINDIGIIDWLFVEVFYVKLLISRVLCIMCRIIDSELKLLINDLEIIDSLVLFLNYRLAGFLRIVDLMAEIDYPPLKTIP